METRDIIEKFEKHHAAVLKMQEDANKAAQSVDTRLAGIEQKMVRRGGGGGADGPESVGQAVVGSSEFKAFRESGGRGLARLELKTVVNLGSGVSGAGATGSMIPPDVRVDPIRLPTRRLTIRDLLAPGTTNSNVVWYPRQTVRQNLAAVVAEGAQKPQSDLTMELVQTPVTTIESFIIASRQALDDAPALQSLVDSELSYNVGLAEESELISGDGSGAHLLGLIPQATAYSGAFAVTGETAIDRLALALLQSELALLPATGIILNFTDWTKIKLVKDGMGRYIIGDPADTAPPQLWGLPVVTTPAITAGTFLVGSFMAAQIFDRMGLEILISTEDKDNFQTNRITVRAEKRLALAVKRPQALITGNLP